MFGFVLDKALQRAADSKETEIQEIVVDEETKKTYMVAGIIGVLGVLVILYKTRK